MMKKTGLSLIYIVLSLVIVVAVVGSISICGFRKNGLDSPIVLTFYDTEQDDPLNAEPVPAEKIKPDIITRKHYFVSDSFMMSSGSQLQIRFRIAYPVPLMHDDIFTDTGFCLQDSQGNDLTDRVCTYSETLMGLNGLNITFVFTDDTYMPQSEEHLVFTIASSQETKALEMEKSYSYARIEFIIP